MSQMLDNGEFTFRARFLEALDPRPWALDGRSGVTYRVNLKLKGSAPILRVTEDVHAKLSRFDEFTLIECRAKIAARDGQVSGIEITDVREVTVSPAAGASSQTAARPS